MARKKNRKIKMTLVKSADEFCAELYIGRKHVAYIRDISEYKTFVLEDGRICIMLDDNGFVVDDLKILDTDR